MGTPRPPSTHALIHTRVIGQRILEGTQVTPGGRPYPWLGVQASEAPHSGSRHTQVAVRSRALNHGGSNPMEKPMPTCGRCELHLERRGGTCHATSALSELTAPRPTPGTHPSLSMSSGEQAPWPLPDLVDCCPPCSLAALTPPRPFRSRRSSHPTPLRPQTCQAWAARPIPCSVLHSPP